MSYSAVYCSSRTTKGGVRDPELSFHTHKKWRQIAKRERRRRIRTQLAKKRDGEGCSDYESLLEAQRIEEDFLREQVEMSNREENTKWLQAEQIALAQWKQLQNKIAEMKKTEHENQLRLKIEMEQELKKKAEDEQRLKQIEEENRQKQLAFMNELNNFLSGDQCEPPPELMMYRETKPESELCPFFSKTSCCRFGDQCSRNHKYPSISNILLAPNFYVHFGLENANYNEYDTDLMLEYEESDTYHDFKEFFNDILPEFQNFGKVVQLKVCNNYEKHLRGNTYIEYADVKSAIAAYQALHTRWYGGRQLSLQFCNISSWKNAICGLQTRRRCPKGRACNFLHVFRNPKNLFNSYFVNNKENLADRVHERSTRSWRWSESPEGDESPRSRSYKRSRERDERREKDERRESSHRRRHEKTRSRSRRRS